MTQDSIIEAVAEAIYDGFITHANYPINALIIPYSEVVDKKLYLHLATTAIGTYAKLKEETQ